LNSGPAEISTVWALGAVVGCAAGLLVGEASVFGVGDDTFPVVGEAAGRVGLAAAAAWVGVAAAFSLLPPQAAATSARAAMARNVNQRSILLRISSLLLGI
jgi:hypothetical protein